MDTDCTAGAPSWTIAVVGQLRSAVGRAGYRYVASYSALPCRE